MFNDYFEKQFLKDLKTIDFKPYMFFEHSTEYFFGGEEWCDLEKNLALVLDKNKSDFIMALYFIELVDMNMYANFKSQYAVFRSKTQFPKFGYVGMGPHHYYPQNIILYSWSKGIIDIKKINQRVEEYVDVFLKQYQENFDAGIFPVPTKDFFSAIINDKDNYKVDPEGFITKSMNLIAKKINHKTE